MATPIILTDTHGDPVLINWDNVGLIEEVRNTPAYTDQPRKFVKTKIWFNPGGTPAEVKESVPEIYQKLLEVL